MSPPLAAADDAIRPKANPNAVVVARTQQSGDRLRLELPFAAPTPAAVFHRADTLWLVFDSAAQIDLTALQADNDNGVREVLFERGDDGAAIVRIKLVRPRMASLEADGPAWIVNIADTTTAPTRPLGIARSIVGKNRASIAIPFDSARAIHTIKDPDVDDRLMVITALGPARGFLKVQDFVELRALPSVHGVVVQPIADDITAELACRQDHDRPADGIVPVGDGARPAAGRGQLSRLHFRHPALGLRSRCAIQCPSVRTDRARRIGARSASAGRRVSTSRAFILRKRWPRRPRPCSTSRSPTSAHRKT